MGNALSAPSEKATPYGCGHYLNDYALLSNYDMVHFPIGVKSLVNGFSVFLRGFLKKTALTILHMSTVSRTVA